MFLAFLTMSWLVYNGIHNPHNTQLKCIHPNACNWLSSDAKGQKTAVPAAKRAVQSVFLQASINSGALQSLGPVVENDKTEHRSTEKVAGEVPILVGEQWRNNTGGQTTSWSQTSASWCIPGQVTGWAQVSASVMLITKSKLTVLWSLWHVTIPLQQPYINVLKCSCSSTEPLAVSTLLNARGFPPLLKGKGTRHEWQVSCVLSWWKSSPLTFNRATSVYHGWKSAGLPSWYTC